MVVDAKLKKVIIETDRIQARGEPESRNMTKNVLEYLEKNASDFPQKTAILYGEDSLTYRELYKNARCVGSGLAGFHLIGKPVPVLMEKGIESLEAFLGIVYAGGFYVMINPAFPSARQRQIIDVLDPALIVTDETHMSQAEELLPGKAANIKTLLQGSEDSDTLFNIREQMIDTDPLYANFTSGSTGIPKGVVVSHRSVVDFIDVFTSLFGIDQSDVIANQAPFDFDVSVKDIYSAIKTGATLVILPMELFSSPARLMDELCEKKVTTMIWAVSALCLISSFHGLDYRTPDTVKRVLFSGEVMPKKHLKSWMEHLGQAEFVNLYGPTEITCNCTYHRIKRDCDYENGIPIGKAFPNEHVFLLDEENKKIEETGITGEICVRGTALALGYYRNESQTSERFVQNPLHSFYQERIYRTGDLGYFGEDKELYFCGRKDFQIKYLGHRIELEEIEAAFEKIDGVDRGCCIFDQKKERLYGFYQGNIDKKELHRQLREILPTYMVPGLLMQVERMPLTKNGKLDRAGLMSLLQERKNKKVNK
jgi:D-alanine--poly(phosphoribitol) ligase subunit 1